MRKILQVSLGIVTAIGGFLEVGSIATAAQGGALFGMRLLWAILLGTVALIVLVEMAGRFAAVSGHTLTDAMRERFGMRFFAIPLVAVTVITWLTLAAEIGGVSLALQMATGIAVQWWALPVALAAWALLWMGTFGLVENGASTLGLVTLAFVVAAVRLHPGVRAVAAGFLPTRPPEDLARYLYVAVSILGASISPYLYLFYSAGAVEDNWTKADTPINRVTAWSGMLFGGTLSGAVLVCAAMVLASRHIQVEAYQQIALILSNPLGRWGFILFVLSLGFTCFGATAEIALATSYVLAQGLGWQWGENLKPDRNARFCLSYTVALVLAAVPIAAGLDPLWLTNVTMTLTAASLPVTVLPMLLLMNDTQYLGEHANTLLGNVSLGLVALLSLVLAAVALPLQVMGG